MLLLKKNIDKFAFVFIAIFTFAVSFCLYTRAEEAVVIEHKYVEGGEEVNDSPFREYEDYYQPTSRRNDARNRIELDDDYFVAKNNVTVKGLFLNTFFILLFLISFLVIIKLLLGRSSFGGQTGLMGGLAERFKGTLFGNPVQDTIKIKQTYMLSPGQVLYIIEIDGRKMLIGATQQGGVHFLTDLSKSSAGELDFRQIEMIQNKHRECQNQNSLQAMGSNGNGQAVSHMSMNTLAQVLEKQENSGLEEMLQENVFKDTPKQEQENEMHHKTSKITTASKGVQNFRRKRTQFRQSLLNTANHK